MQRRTLPVATLLLGAAPLLAHAQVCNSPTADNYGRSEECKEKPTFYCDDSAAVNYVAGTQDTPLSTHTHDTQSLTTFNYSHRKRRAN